MGQKTGCLNYNFPPEALRQMGYRPGKVTFKKIQQAYIDAEQENAKAKEDLDAKIERAEKRLDNLKNKRREIGHISWINKLLKPIVDIITKVYPDRDVEILGPFGICSKTSIHIYKRGVEDKDKCEGDNCLSVTLEPGDLSRGELRLVDYSKNTGRFRPGTIGAINGMNHSTVLVTSINQILKAIS